MKRVFWVLTLILCCTTAWAKKENKIVVKTAEEFISALGADRTIVIDSKTPLMLTPALEEFVSDVRVVVFTAPNGNTITIPTNGYADEDGNQEFGFFGYYWTSSRTDGDEYTYPLGFVVKVPDQMCQVEKLIDQLCVGVRLVRDKAK